MRVLVTGATGFIGKRLVQKLAGKHRIICFVLKPSNVDNLEKIGAEIRYGDLLDRNSVFSAVKNADAVIHLATSHFQGNEKGNIKGTKNLIDACKKNKIGKMIFVSSMAVKRKNLDSYGRAKLEIEKMLKSSGLKYVILRPSVIYSEDNLSLIGTSLKSLPFIIPIIGTGKYKMSPVYVDDVAEAISRAAGNKKAVGKEYDIAGGKSISFNEIIKICRERFKIRKITVHVPISLAVFLFKFIPLASTESIRGIEEDSNADITGLKKDLHFVPLSFREGIKNVII